MVCISAVKKQKVVILQKTCSEYRIAFFDLLFHKLREDNISLVVIFGSPFKNVELYPWAFVRATKSIRLGGSCLIWQPCLSDIRDADLVITEHANKLLIIYILILRKLVSKRKFAFWGHGRNLQSFENSIFNNMKRLHANTPNWWFAYTAGVKDYLVKNNFDQGRISVVQNALDSKKMLADYQSITELKLTELRAFYNIHPDEKVLVYCGAFYKEKRIDFLISAADALVKEGLKIKLLLMGDSSVDEHVMVASQSRDWLLVVGPKYHAEKAALFKLSDLFLLPGAIGLSVIDSFVFETPIVTTKYAFHGPEFAYLKDGKNGIISGDSLEEYVECVSMLLNSPEKLADLKRCCKEDALTYTVENMANNFHEGIVKALAVN